MYWKTLKIIAFIFCIGSTISAVSVEVDRDLVSEAAEIPEVEATSAWLDLVVKAIQGRPSFRVKLQFDSENKNLGALSSGAANILIPFQKEVEIPFDKEKPEQGRLLFSTKGLVLKGRLDLTEAGAFSGKFHFESKGQAVPMEASIRYMGIPENQFRFYSINLDGSGAGPQSSKVILSGDCVLQQLVLDVLNVPGEYSEVWTDTECNYEYSYDRESKKLKYKFNYDSLKESAPVVSPRG